MTRPSNGTPPRGTATGGPIPPHAMRRVDHYDRAQVLMPNGHMMCSYTPVFEETDDDTPTR